MTLHPVFVKFYFGEAKDSKIPPRITKYCNTPSNEVYKVVVKFVVKFSMFMCSLQWPKSPLPNRKELRVL